VGTRRVRQRPHAFHFLPFGEAAPDSISVQFDTHHVRIEVIEKDIGRTAVAASGHSHVRGEELPGSGDRQRDFTAGSSRP